MTDKLYEHLVEIMNIMMLDDYFLNMEELCVRLTEATELDENVLWQKFRE